MSLVKVTDRLVNSAATDGVESATSAAAAKTLIPKFRILKPGSTRRIAILLKTTRLKNLVASSLRERVFIPIAR
jgi:hypothetical protein